MLFVTGFRRCYYIRHDINLNVRIYMSLSLRITRISRTLFTLTYTLLLAANLVNLTAAHAINASKTPTKAPTTNAIPNTQSYTILEQIAHDPNSFTQGFSLKDGIFYESSGLYKKSYLRKYADDNSTTHIKTPLDDRLFAEGLEIVGDKLYLLTWQAEQLLVFNKNTLKHEQTLAYEGEGWGLTHNGKHFYMSNGSEQISIRDTDDFSQKRHIQVHDAQRSYRNINELEYAKGFLWANVWQSNLILKIQPFSGFVVATYDLTPLTRDNSTQPRHSVLNGIAFDEARDAFWITGKLWPNRYLLQFNDKKPQA